MACLQRLSETKSSSGATLSAAQGRLVATVTGRVRSICLTCSISALKYGTAPASSVAASFAIVPVNNHTAVIGRKSTPDASGSWRRTRDHRRSVLVAADQTGECRLVSRQRGGAGAAFGEDRRGRTGAPLAAVLVEAVD